MGGGGLLIMSTIIPIMLYLKICEPTWQIKWFSIFAGFFVPFFLIYTYSYLFDNIVLCIFAVLLSFIGMIAERWLFFAQAKHVVNLYHGSQQC